MSDDFITPQACGSPAPAGNLRVCVRPAGHRGHHDAGRGEWWPGQCGDTRDRYTCRLIGGHPGQHVDTTGATASWPRTIPHPWPVTDAEQATTGHLPQQAAALQAENDRLVRETAAARGRATRLNAALVDHRNELAAVNAALRAEQADHLETRAELRAEHDGHNRTRAEAAKASRQCEAPTRIPGPNLTCDRAAGHGGVHTATVSNGHPHSPEAPTVTWPQDVPF